MTSTARSVGQLARAFVNVIDPQELPNLSESEQAYLQRKRDRRLIVQSVVQPTRRQTPAGMGSEIEPSAANTVLVVLNAIVAGSLGVGDEGRRGWLHGRRLTRRLGRVSAQTSANTLVPTFPREQADRIAVAAGKVALRSGLPVEQAERLSQLVRDAITDPGPR
jgi:hypothetical protein